MATENENKDTAAEQPKHQSWLDNALEKLNTDFPLSGGETNEDLERAEAAIGLGHSHVVADTAGADLSNDPAHPSHPEHPEHESWLKNALLRVEDALSKINTDFPLSGGETNEDLENVEKAK